jgi:hypothetical protein
MEPPSNWTKGPPPSRVRQAPRCLNPAGATLYGELERVELSPDQASGRAAAVAAMPPALDPATLLTVIAQV